MKGKGGKKEEVDFSTLPKANMIISTILMDLKNPETKYKLFETFYKNLQNDTLFHFITREHIIEYAKENKIYEDPAEVKKPAKGEPIPEHKEISPWELSKAALGLIMERSIPCRKEKKIIFDKIEEAEKEKEEAEKYWKEQEEIEKKLKENEEKDDKKKKEEKKKEDKNKKVYPKPEEIEIPKYDEYTNEMFVILYNYPLSEEEFMCLENEKNENNDEVTINLFHLMNDIDEYVPPQQEEVVLDKKGKPIQKEAKLDKDQALIQKYFTSTLLIPKKDILDTENDEKKDDEMNDTKTSKMNKKEEEKKEEEKKR